MPLTEVRLINGIPLPILDLELGPAVQTASRARSGRCASRAANDEFHRVAFGLIAPAGTTSAEHALARLRHHSRTRTAPATAASRPPAATSTDSASAPT